MPKQTPPLEYSVSIHYEDGLVIHTVWPKETASQNAYTFHRHSERG